MKTEKSSAPDNQLNHESDTDIEVDEFDPAFAHRVVRKIDYWLIPLLFVTYNFNFMDKTILSSASVFGLREDTVSFSFSFKAALQHYM